MGRVEHRTGSRERRCPLGQRAAGFAAFGPSLVYCTGVWMQIDEVVCFLMVLALWRLSRGKFWQGCLWYGAALAVKPQALLAGPVLALCALLPLLQEGAAGLTAALKRGVGGAVCALAPVLAAALPFGLTRPRCWKNTWARPRATPMPASTPLT